MDLDIVASPGSSHQVHAARLLQSGLARHGIAARIVEGHGDARSPVVACWGWRQGRRHHSRGRRVLLMERGFVGSRVEWTALGWDGLAGRGRFPAVDDGGERWRKHFDGLLAAPRSGGGFGLVLGQVPGDTAIEGVDMARTYDRLRDRLAATGLPVHFRQHPVDAARRGPQARICGMRTLEGTLAEALAGAAVAAAYNSNSLTDAALAGVPSLAVDHGTMAWPVVGQGWGAAPTLRAREGWAHRLAWCQWRDDEIASGAAWEVVRTAMEPTAQAA